MRQRRVLAHLDAGAAGKAEPLVRRRDEIRELVLGHPVGERLPRRLVGLERHLGRQPHQRQLVLIFHHAAPGRDRRAARYADRRRRGGNHVREDEADGFLDPQRPAGDAGITESPRHERRGAFVLLPRHNPGVGAEWPGARLLQGALLLEPGRDNEGFAARRDDDGGHALRQPPLHAGEVDHRRTAREHQRVDAVFGQEAACLLEPRPALAHGDGSRLVLHRCQGRDGRRQCVGGGTARVIGAFGDAARGTGDRQRGGLNEAAAGQHERPPGDENG